MISCYCELVLILLISVFCLFNCIITVHFSAIAQESVAVGIALRVGQVL